MLIYKMKNLIVIISIFFLTGCGNALSNLGERIKDPPGYRNLSDRQVCIKHFEHLAYNDTLNKTLSSNVIELRNLDCSQYAAEENNVLLKKQQKQKIKCWTVDGITKCYKY